MEVSSVTLKINDKKKKINDSKENLSLFFALQKIRFPEWMDKENSRRTCYFNKY